MRRRAAALATLLAVAGAGCGEADGERAVEAVHRFVAALERGDGQMACDRLTDRGMAELLLAAVHTRTRTDGLDAPAANCCSLLAARLAARSGRLAGLRRSRVGAVRIEGDRATVETRAGAYELEERDGRWRLSRFAPVARVLAGEPAASEPVHLAVVRPKLREPALGATLAGRADDDVAELSGTLEPANAGLEEQSLGATRVTRVEARDGRFRVRLELARGHNVVVLTAHAPGRRRTALAVRLFFDG